MIELSNVILCLLELISAELKQFMMVIFDPVLQLFFYFLNWMNCSSIVPGDEVLPYISTDKKIWLDSMNLRRQTS